METLTWKYGEPLQSEELLSEFEEKTSFTLPEDFKEIVKAHNGSRPSLKIFDAENEEGHVFGALLSFNKEDTVSIWSVNKEIPESVDSKYIAFALDAFGNYIAFDAEDGSIVFIDHETNKVSNVAGSFADLINSLYSDDDDDDEDTVTDDDVDDSNPGEEDMNIVDTDDDSGDDNTEVIDESFKSDMRKTNLENDRKNKINDMNTLKKIIRSNISKIERSEGFGIQWHIQMGTDNTQPEDSDYNNAVKYVAEKLLDLKEAGKKKDKKKINTIRTELGNISGIKDVNNRTWRFSVAKTSSYINFSLWIRETQYQPLSKEDIKNSVFIHFSSASGINELKPQLISSKYGNETVNKNSYQYEECQLYRTEVVYIWAIRKGVNLSNSTLAAMMGYGNNIYMYEASPNDKIVIDRSEYTFRKTKVPAVTIETTKPLPVKKISKNELMELVKPKNPNDGMTEGTVFGLPDDMTMSTSMNDLTGYSYTTHSTRPETSSIRRFSSSSDDSSQSQVKTTPSGFKFGMPQRDPSKTKNNENKNTGDDVVKENAMFNFDDVELEEDDFINESFAIEGLNNLHQKLVSNLGTNVTVSEVQNKQFVIHPKNGNPNDKIVVSLKDKGHVQVVGYSKSMGNVLVCKDDTISVAIGKIRSAFTRLFGNFRIVSESYNEFKISKNGTSLTRWGGVIQEADTDNDDEDIDTDAMEELDYDMEDEEDNEPSSNDDNDNENAIAEDDIEIGVDITDQQNEYDQKDLDYLNKLIASESSAVSEYFIGAKETKVPILSKVYTDIGDEERFHLEQLMYAKSQLTGEAYEPRDLDVKREYEELLALGMDSETAMATAIDKRSISADNPDDEEDAAEEVGDAIETLEYACTAMDMYSIILETENSVNVHKCMKVITEAYVFQEAVETNDSDAKVKIPYMNPFVLIGKLFKAIVTGLKKLTTKFRKWQEKAYRNNKRKKEWIKRHGIKALFESGIHLYFYDDARPDLDMQTVFYQLIDRVDASLEVIGKTYGITTGGPIKLNRTWQPLQFATPAQAAKALKNINLTKTKVVVNDQTSAALERKFFGVTDEKFTNLNGGKSSYNTYNIFDNCLTFANNFLENKVKAIMQAVEGMANDTNSLYHKNPKAYKELCEYMKVTTETMDKIIKCVTNDLGEYVKVNNTCMKEATAEADNPGSSDDDDVTLKLDPNATTTETPTTTEPSPETSPEPTATEPTPESTPSPSPSPSPTPEPTSTPEPTPGAPKPAPDSGINVDGFIKAYNNFLKDGSTDKLVATTFEYMTTPDAGTKIFKYITDKKPMVRKSSSLLMKIKNDSTGAIGYVPDPNHINTVGDIVGRFNAKRGKGADIFTTLFEVFGTDKKPIDPSKIGSMSSARIKQVFPVQFNKDITELTPNNLPLSIVQKGGIYL